ncbi:uncharacterized protein amer3 [Paramisgurnus dabryanus]|uniref:uncharacterized protein amer3 n=1 Tax=Paramisgurnus dabryanus TaxID=90735 RepID=UPI0031F3DFD2
MEMAKNEDPPKDRKSLNKSATHRHSKSNDGQSDNSPDNGCVTTTVGSPCSLPVPDTPKTGDSLCRDGACQLRGSVKKSKTCDFVRGMGQQQPESPKYKDGTYWRHKLMTSVSFSGFDAPLRLLCENRNVSGSSHEIIDYRNLTPQVPFVPCIAKSIPKKKTSPRKAIKDVFVPKRHKHEKALSPSTPCRVARVNAATLKRTKKYAKHKEHARSRYNEHSETPSDSSGEYSNVCEDVASLKSFGSQAGCGEIFADEDCVVSPDSVLNAMCDRKASKPQVRQIPTAIGIQGGNECLASPAHVGVLDMFGLWETLYRTRTDSSRALGNTTETPSPIAKSPSTCKSQNVITNPLRPLEAQIIRELNTDVISPKSDNQENTSDEGYCDYVSPVSEDHSKNSLTPVHSKTFPRDTYSGDALYELFCDPIEPEMTPIFDDELDLTDSIIGQCSDLPLSMYSFHVGAEENLAPPLSRDFIGQELLQSKWMGKDCLLKLCDTEISLAMGIVNWLKQKTDKTNPAEMMSSRTNSEETDNLCMSPGVGKPQRGTGNDDIKDALNCKQSKLDLPSQHEVNTLMSTVVSPESLPKTPSSGVCFRIYNIDSPVTPSGDLQSPVVSSPGSGTRSLFVLAINKESLCESCKRYLKNGAKKLSLCRSCRSLIEHIKTSDVWAHASFPQCKTLTAQPISKDLLSPASTCAIGSDISIASLVEQCASQFSSMKINLTQKQLSCDKRGAFEPDQGVRGDTENFQKYLKSKCKKTPITTAERESGLYSRLSLRRPSLSEDVHKPSRLETEALGFVTNNGPNDDVVLETYKNPSCTESDDPVAPQTTRPTSLPLVTPASSEFFCGEDHHLKRMEHGSRTKRKHRLPHHKKSAVNSEGSCGYGLPKERKVERRYRMKK